MANLKTPRQVTYGWLMTRMGRKVNQKWDGSYEK
jgi:hypothetical protein